jgi:hypothetical protein
MCFFFSCKKEKQDVVQIPAKEIFLKDVVINTLPSPYYHFEYAVDGHITKAGFADAQALYELSYNGNRMREMKNLVAGNKDRLVYNYDNQNRISKIDIIDKGGISYKRCFLDYGENNRLQAMEWELKADIGGFVADRTVHFSYDANGNLLEKREQQFAIEGRQAAALYIDRFDDYDDKINTADFMLLHKNNEHLILLPGVVLQRNNPLSEIRSGSSVNYKIRYQYTYNSNRTISQRKGQVQILTGTGAGQEFESVTSFSYYH